MSHTSTRHAIAIPRRVSQRAAQMVTFGRDTMQL